MSCVPLPPEVVISKLAAPVKWNVPSPPIAVLMTCSVPFTIFVLVNVQVTVSPEERLMALIGLPSEQIALVGVHPACALSVMEYVPAASELLFGVVPSASV